MALYLAETFSGIAIFVFCWQWVLVFAMSSNSINNLYQTLEFHKVLEDLAKRTHCSLSADHLLSAGRCYWGSPDLVFGVFARLRWLWGVDRWERHSVVGEYYSEQTVAV